MLLFAVKDERLEAVILYNRGIIKYRMGSNHDALADLEMAVQKDPDNKEFKEAVLNVKEKK